MQLQEMPVPETLDTEVKNNGYDFFFYYQRLYKCQNINITIRFFVANVVWWLSIC